MGQSTVLVLIFEISASVQLSDFRLLTLGANYPRTFVTFGHPQAKGTYNSYLLNEMETGSYDIWTTSQWNHFCLSYHRDGAIRTVKVHCTVQYYTYIIHSKVFHTAI